jgi:Flp pilus assembly protein TadG
MHEAPSTPQARWAPPRPRKALVLLSALRREQRGTAVVEFALIAIPLCLIVFGIIDFGRALNYYNDVTQLAGAGARAASVNTNIDGTAADGNFQADLAAQNDSPELTNKVQVCIQSVPTQVGQPVTVTVKYRFHFTALVASIPITLRASQSVRSEVANPGYSATCTPAVLP